MLPDKETILVCPHCGTEKAVLALASGNTFGGRQWWDLKTDYPMLPHVSYVQKCLCCNKYYMRNLVEHRKRDNYSFEQGLLSYAEMRDALAQMKDSLQGPERVNLLIEYVWAYNDAFQREGVERDEASPDDEKLKEFQSVVRELVGILPADNRLVYAELLRDERKRQKLTQQQLGERIGKKREYISALEQGQTDMQLSTFMLIANALGLRFSLVVG